MLDYKDILETPRYGSNKRFFNDYLILLSDDAKSLSHIESGNKGLCFINYSVSEFSPNLRRLEDQINEYKNSGVNTGFHIFRCPREYASAYIYGYPDYSSLNTVWVTIFQSVELQKSIRYMLWYHTTYLMSGSFISKDKASVLGLKSIKIDKPSGNNDEEEVYTAFKTETEEKNEDNLEVIEKQFSRRGKCAEDAVENNQVASNTINEIKSNPSNNKKNAIETKEPTKGVAQKQNSNNNNTPSLSRQVVIQRKEKTEDLSAEEDRNDDDSDQTDFDSWNPSEIDDQEEGQ